MRAGAGLRPVMSLLLVCAVAVTVAGCGGAGGDQAGDALELEEKWHGRISDAVAAKPEGCRGGVGSACETHAAAIHAVTEQLREDVAARADKERYQAALDGAAAIDKNYDEYFGKLCATVPETTLDAATTQLFMTCSGLYTTIITGAGDLQQNLRPSDGASEG
ncbi:hypothetical protein [Streptomyces formicae]|uniref:Lipoprotein n=1 Tax=Streptomyces formicae TaxID=1616117 RepID=A0ABY3WKW2_9ACTN|nr:hypothetical protein [Streptomyces formicae]UNM13259.1 hypothetical protein J4032_18755 [Streptomyces formicae]